MKQRAHGTSIRATESVVAVDSITRWLCLWLFAALSSPGLLMAEDNPAFRYIRPIEISDADPQELFSVNLDSEVYGATRDGFPDVRVLDSSQRLVPFLIQPLAETRIQLTRRSWTASEPVLRPLENNGMEIWISLSKDEPSPRGLRFFTPLKNFEQQVQVSAVRDGVEHSLVDAALIFDYSQYMDVRHTEIPLPENTDREFRIVVDTLTAEQESPLVELSRSVKGDAEEGRSERTVILRRPFRIDRLEFWTEHHEEISEAKIVRSWPVSGLKVTQDPGNKETHVEFDSRREPLTRLKLVSSGRNFSRRTEVQRLTRSDWEKIAEATVSVFHVGDFHEEQMTIEIPETRGEKFRLIVRNGDSPEIPIEGIEAVGTQHQLVFLRQPGQILHMVYGSDTAQVPEHDTAAVSYALARNLDPAAATLGAPSQNPAASPRPFVMKDILNNPFVLGTVVILLVTILGWGLYGASRRIDQMPRSDGE
jgi:hypothetical protein